MSRQLFNIQLTDEDRRDLEELARILYERRILPTAHLSEATRWAWRHSLETLHRELASLGMTRWDGDGTSREIKERNHVKRDA